MGTIAAPRTLATRLAQAALALAVSAAAVACSSGSATKAVSLKSGPTPVAPAGTLTSSPPTSTDGAVPGATQPAPGAPTTVASGAPGATTATTKPGVHTAPTPAPGPNVTNPASSGPAPVTPGTYNYRLVSGQSILTTGTTSTTLAVAPTGTLVVTATGSGTEQWVNSSTTTSVLFNGAGVFLLSETVPLVNATCTFSSPVPSPPWPLAVGKPINGSATCGQGQSSSTLSLHGSVTGTESLPLDGAAVSTFVVETTMTLANTNLVVVEKDWYAPSLRLPVKSTVGVQGGITGYSIVSATTYALTSSRPS